MQPEPRIPAGLPAPDESSLRHSERVADFIRNRIAEAGGTLSFGEFMQHALYAPALGYYVAGARKFGAAGDFVTAPEISPLFGYVIARQAAPVLSSVRGGAVLELGAGSGALAVALLERLATLDALPERYYILEVSADLVERQRERIGNEAPEIATRVEWIDRLPEALGGVIVANEVVDALPFERFERSADGVLERRVAVGENGFVEVSAPAAEPLAALGRRLPAGYTSELSRALPGWIGDLVDTLSDGIVLLFDYGLPAHEYYAPDRDTGWMRCHFRHHVHDQALIYPGIQDITTWVDFTAVARAAVARSADVAGFVTQALFLMNGGLENEFAGLSGRSSAEQFELAGQIRRLTLPGEMGENFKCIGLRKGSAPVPDAFRNGDRTHVL